MVTEPALPKVKELLDKEKYLLPLNPEVPVVPDVPEVPVVPEVPLVPE